MENQLTNEERLTLRMVLLTTTQYRLEEQKACARLGSELDENGDIKYPNMASNALWWKDTNTKINKILEKL